MLRCSKQLYVKGKKGTRAREVAQTRDDGIRGCDGRNDVLDNALS